MSRCMLRDPPWRRVPDSAAPCAARRYISTHTRLCHIIVTRTRSTSSPELIQFPGRNVSLHIPMPARRPFFPTVPLTVALPWSSVARTLTSKPITKGSRHAFRPINFTWCIPLPLRRCHVLSFATLSISLGRTFRSPAPRTLQMASSQLSRQFLNSLPTSRRYLCRLGRITMQATSRQAQRDLRDAIILRLRRASISLHRSSRPPPSRLLGRRRHVNISSPPYVPSPPFGLFGCRRHVAQRSSQLSRRRLCLTANRLATLHNSWALTA